MKIIIESMWDGKFFCDFFFLLLIFSRFLLDERISSFCLLKITFPTYIHSEKHGSVSKTDVGC